jgi:hypothetical protein
MLCIHVHFVLGLVGHHLPTLVTLQVQVRLGNVGLEDCDVAEDFGAVWAGNLVGAVVLSHVHGDVSHCLAALGTHGVNLFTGVGVNAMRPFKMKNIK